MRIYATAPFTERIVESDFDLGMFLNIGYFLLILSASFWMIFRANSLSDTFSDGYILPAGSEVFLSPMLLHHNPMVFVSLHNVRITIRLITFIRPKINLLWN